jgi:hypothetical protein
MDANRREKFIKLLGERNAMLSFKPDTGDKLMVLVPYKDIEDQGYLFKNAGEIRHTIIESTYNSLDLYFAMPLEWKKANGGNFSTDVVYLWHAFDPRVELVGTDYVLKAGHKI